MVKIGDSCLLTLNGIETKPLLAGCFWDMVQFYIAMNLLQRNSLRECSINSQCFGRSSFLASIHWDFQWSSWGTETDWGSLCIWRCWINLRQQRLGLPHLANPCFSVHSPCPPTTQPMIPIFMIWAIGNIQLAYIFIFSQLNFQVKEIVSKIYDKKLRSES